MPGSKRRTDVDDILRLLLRFGADPNQRGVNDCTPLHIAVAARDALAVQILLEGGANSELRTRIDECETPLEMATGAGMTAIAEILARKGEPLRRRLKSGLKLLVDIPGSGDLVRRQKNYRIRLRLWLNRGEAVRWQTAWGPADIARLEDNGETLITEIRIDRRSLVNGLFYGVEGMRVGGTRPAGNFTPSGLRRSRGSGSYPRWCHADRGNHDTRGARLDRRSDKTIGARYSGWARPGARLRACWPNRSGGIRAEFLLYNGLPGNNGG